MLNSCYTKGFKKMLLTIFFRIFQLMHTQFNFLNTPSCYRRQNERYMQCSGNNMTVSLEKRTFQFFEASQLHLRYSSCRATHNSTHLLVSTPLNDCGTLVNGTEDALIFWNEILADAVIIDYVVTRTHNIKIPFYCSYSRKTLLSIRFTPQRIYFGTEGIARTSVLFIFWELLLFF